MDNKYISLILFIGLIVIVIWVGYSALDIQKQASEATTSWCNEHYGINNWTFEPKERQGFRENIYIGEIWECKQWKR